MRKKLLLIVGMFGVAIAAASFNFGNNKVYATVPGINTLVSTSYQGNYGGDDGSERVMLSKNGKYVAFESMSTNIIPGLTNVSQVNKSQNNNIFLKNLVTGDTQLVTQSTNGAQADQMSGVEAISATGHYILFASRATNLIDGSTYSGGNYLTYLRDTVAGTTTRVSQTPSGDLPDQVQAMTGLAISSDGRFILFNSKATNLGPALAHSNYQNLYMLDRDSGNFSLLDTYPDGTNGMSGIGVSGSMSCDGSIVAFQSKADLTQNSGAAQHSTIYILDRRAGNKMTALTLNANEASDSPMVSCNGDYVAFMSQATNLSDPNATDPGQYPDWHGYVYDRINGTYTMMDQTGDGQPANVGMDGGTVWSGVYRTSNQLILDVSDDGSTVFESKATNLSTLYTTGTDTQIFVHNSQSGTTELLSRSSDGAPANSSSSEVTISADGELTAYESQATNLVTANTYNLGNDYTSKTGY